MKQKSKKIKKLKQKESKIKLNTKFEFLKD